MRAAMIDAALGGVLCACALAAIWGHDYGVAVFSAAWAAVCLLLVAHDLTREVA